ncbi:MAG: ATP phosphoribosyltransferase regulatory subunit [Clostridia bacterium]|nr:ATP phosphoribosyltransferase regulatory subunit [Clostridia bacterium]
MSTKRKNIPDGMRDMIYSENKTERKLGERISALYEKRGYGSVATPALEYYDVFNFDSQTIAEENMFKLTDKSGRLVVIRPDNTTPMARIASTRLGSAPRPLKLYYNQNVYRISGDFSGKRCEFAQTGIEIIGGKADKADLEAIVTALRTLREMGDFYGGGINYKLELGHALFCKALIDSFGLDEEKRETVTKYISAKNSSSLEVVFGDGNEAREMMEKVRQIPRLYGTKSVISKARQLCVGVKQAEDALDYLENVYDILDENGFSENISIDLATVNDMNYYTGIVFRGYLDYTGQAILGGGRYDNLMSNFGSDEGATGFGVNLSLVSDKLSRIIGTQEENTRKTLVHYGDVKLLSKAMSYIENSSDVCVLSCFDNVDDAVENAKESNISRVIEITASGICEVWSE